jgi:hypothetical protein
MLTCQRPGAADFDSVGGRERLDCDGAVEQAAVGHLACYPCWVVAAIRDPAQDLTKVDRGKRCADGDHIRHNIGARLVTEVRQQRRRVQDCGEHLLAGRFAATLSKQLVDHRLTFRREASQHPATLIGNRPIWTQPQGAIALGAQQQPAPRLEPERRAHVSGQNDAPTVTDDDLTLSVGHMTIVPRASDLP